MPDLAARLEPMRIVLCDEDPMLRDVVEDVVVKTGHEVVGMADSTAAAVGLLDTARPDAMVVDLWLGFDSDYDLIQMAIDRSSGRSCSPPAARTSCGPTPSRWRSS